MKEEFVKNKQTKLEINQCQCMALFQSYFENIYIYFLNLRQLGKFETRQIIFLYWKLLIFWLVKGILKFRYLHIKSEI